MFITAGIPADEFVAEIVSRGLSLEKLVGIFGEVIVGFLNAVSHFHDQHSLVHLDIHPGQVLVKDDSGKLSKKKPVIN